MDKNIKNLLGIAYIAKKVLLSDTALLAIRKNQGKLVFIANDASEKSIKKYTDKCKYYQVPYYLIFNTNELSEAVGKYNRKLLVVTDEGFANKIKNEIERRGIDGKKKSQ